MLSQLSGRLMVGLLAIGVIVAGCATPNPGSQARTPEGEARAPGVSAGSQADAAADPRQWAMLSRAGRQAMRPQAYDEAEKLFVAALAAVADRPAHDARIHTTLRQLVTLAAIYQRLERDEDAQRVLFIVTEYADSRGVARYADDAYDTRYRTLVKEPLGFFFRPAPEPDVPGPHTLDGLIARTAQRFQVDPALVKAVVAAESNFDSRAVSRAGALGLMQLMPETAREMGVRAPFKPSENLKGGVRYLREMLDRYGDLDHALAAYNAGPNAVDRYGGIPPYPETRSYVKRVLENYRDYQGQLSN